jgi:hypothetical protein
LGTSVHHCDQDLAVANNNSSDVSILKNLGDGGFQLESNYSAGIWPLSITAADFDDDGDPDLATANMQSDNISVLINVNALPPVPCCDVRMVPDSYPIYVPAGGHSITFIMGAGRVSPPCLRWTSEHHDWLISTTSSVRLRHPHPRSAYKNILHWNRMKHPR